MQASSDLQAETSKQKQAIDPSDTDHDSVAQDSQEGLSETSLNESENAASQNASSAAATFDLEASAPQFLPSDNSRKQSSAGWPLSLARCEPMSFTC